MAIDNFVAIENVTSESTHVGHVGEIDCISWQWNVAQTSALGSGIGGDAKGKATPGEFIFVHQYDKASPTIAKYCISGKHFPSVVATSCQAGEGQKDFLTVTMKECMIISVAPSADRQGGVLETVSLAYSDIQFDYKPMDGKGQQGGSITMGWNIRSTETR